MKLMTKVQWSSCGRTHVGMVRTINQDCFADLPDKHLWVVADGMGGHKDGHLASNKIVEMLKQFEPEKQLEPRSRKFTSVYMR